MKSHCITIYNKDTRLKASLAETFQTLGHNAWSYRWLIWRSFKRDFSAPYKQSFLGLGWSFIVPMIPITAYLVLVFMGVLDTRAGMPFFLYVSIGMTLWLFLSGGIYSVINSIQSEKAVITKVKFPLVVVILSGFGKVCSDTLIRLFFVVFAFAFFGVMPHWNIVFAPLIVLPFVLLSFGLGIMIGLLNVVVHDTKIFVDMFLSYGMFISSVFFALPTSGPFSVFADINIFSQFIAGIREFLVFGHLTNVAGYAISSLMAVLLFLFAVRSLYCLEYKIKGHL